MFKTLPKFHSTLLVIILFTYTQVNAQIILNRSDVSIAEEAIVDLHNGALVLRLKSYNNKITRLKELIANPDVKDKDREKLEKELETTISERDSYNNDLVAAFNDNYKFSPVYFMYDTSSVALKNGARKGFLLDENLRVDPTISISEDSVFMAYIGTLDPADYSGVEALIITDSQFEVLPAPFPFYIRVNSLGLVLGKIFSPKQSVKRDTQKMVSKLEHKLSEFYARVLEKNRD